MNELGGRVTPAHRGRPSHHGRAAMMALLLVGSAAGSIGAADAEQASCPAVAVVGCPPAPPESTTTSTPVAPTTTSAVPTTTAPPPTAPPTTTTTTPTTSSTAVAASADAAAARLVALLNEERSRDGLQLLSVRDDVRAIATRWSVELADRGRLAHNDDYFTADTKRRLGARALGENVARAADADRAHRALMDSAGHRANILDPRFTVIGVGAVLRDGSWWFTQDFVQPIELASTPEPTQASERPPGERTPPIQTERPASSRAVVAADTDTAVMAEVDPPAADGTVLLDRRGAPSDPRATGGVGASPWTALAALTLTVPLFVLVGAARRRAVLRLRPDGTSSHPTSPEPEAAGCAPGIAHHLAVIDAWIKTLDDRWQTLSESDRLIAVQVIRRNAQAAIDAQPARSLAQAHHGAPAA